VGADHPDTKASRMAEAIPRHGLDRALQVTLALAHRGNTWARQALVIYK
jgi:hypothetical protein